MSPSGDHFSTFNNYWDASKSFEDIHAKELEGIANRREHANCDRQGCSGEDAVCISTKNQLLGLALSGGGIRSAAVNLGNVQVLQEAGLFDEIDFLSTVSGGGYLGTSLSVLMRKGGLETEPQGNVGRQPTNESGSETDTADSENATDCSQSSSSGGESGEKGKYSKSGPINIRRRKKWRPRASLLLREMVSKLHGESKWINVSDGGHVENLGAFELLRRRCEVVIVGEGESDATGGFPGLSTLMRLAEIDLGIEIEFPKGSLEKLILPKNFDELSGDERESQIDSQRHFAVAKIHYPKSETQPEEVGYLLYVRSSLRGDEDQIIKSYQKSNQAFPHESTADQMFNEGQFEAYRRLGVKMMEEALGIAMSAQTAGENSYEKLVSYLRSYPR